MDGLTNRHHAIYVEDKWTLPKVYADVFSRLLHTYGGKELPFYLTESGTYPTLVLEKLKQTVDRHISSL